MTQSATLESLRRISATQAQLLDTARKVAMTTNAAPRRIDTRSLTYAQVDALAKQVPAGRYALPKVNPTADNDVTFFEISEGRNGAHYVRQLLGAPGDFTSQPLALALQYFAVTHLLEDLKSAAVLFGRTTGTCSQCGSPLTNRKSREAGIGPVCARRVG
jgi:hypothetical protein